MAAEEGKFVLTVQRNRIFANSWTEEPLAGVPFAIFNIEPMMVNGHDSFDEIKSEIDKYIADKGWENFAKDYPQAIFLTSGKTNLNGQVKFTLNEHGHYLILETAQETPDGYRAQNLFLNLPYTDDKGNLYFDDEGRLVSEMLVNIKGWKQDEGGLPETLGLSLIKTDYNGKVLAGAQFVIYRETIDGKNEYLTNETTGEHSNEPIFEALSPDSSQVRKFISDDQGRVYAEGYIFPDGTYHFSEYRAPNGYEIIEEAKKVTFCVAEEGTKKYFIDKQYQIIEGGQIKVRNKPDTPTSSTTSTTSGGRLPDTPGNRSYNSSDGGFLPSTGEMIQYGAVVIGLILVIGVVVVNRKRKS
ncbi:MAG: LPXTG cell wall anchor domain-containing protein [Streptococcaceae bacterium]|nr:LPXTG cell wall anchor domain-containing protein [Streptococcaceae bacterium]